MDVFEDVGNKVSYAELKDDVIEDNSLGAF